MSTALAKRTTNAAVVAVDLDNIDIDAALGALDRASSKIGLATGGGAKRVFPGQSYFMKKGSWYFGQGKKAEAIDDPTLVVNVPHLGAAYLKFEENTNGKIFPKYSDVAILALGQDVVDRESLGDTDEDEWPVDDKDVPQDPWTLQIVIPAREQDSTEYNHVLATSKTNHNMMARLFGEAMQEMKLKPGQLPIVRFGVTELSRQVPAKNGKGRPQTQTWNGMTYEIVGWTDVEPCDRLNQNVDLGEDAEDMDAGKVKATARTATKKPVAQKAAASAPKALPAPKGKEAPAKAKKKVADL